MLELWRASQGGMGGAGPLPFAGGYAEQPAGLMAAFRYMAAADAKIRNLTKPRRQR